MSVELMFARLGKSIDRALACMSRTLCIIFRYAGNDESRAEVYEKRQAIASPYAVLVFDSFIAFLSIFLSIHLRIGMDFLDYSPSYIIKNMVVFGLVSSSVFLWLHIYQSFWKYMSIEDVVSIFLSVILSNLIFFPLMVLMNQEDLLPYSVLIINVLVHNVMLLIPRFLTKSVYNQKIKKLKESQRLIRKSKSPLSMTPILLLGSSGSVESFLQEVIINEDIPFNFTPVGILALNPEDVGRTIKGIPIVGEVSNISAILEDMQRRHMLPRQIVVTEKSIPKSMKDFLIEKVQDYGLLVLHVMHQCTINPISE
jgi:O-antigen biosynthesis protein WbqV